MTSGERHPLVFLCTDLDLTAEAALSRFVVRRRLDTAFHEVREHKCVETQWQWSDLSLTILRTTPLW